MCIARPFAPLILSIVLLTPGCDTTSQQRLAALQAALKTAETASKDYDSRLAAMEPAITALTQMLTDPNVTGATAQQVKTTLADLKAKYAAVKALKAAVDEKMTAYSAVLAKAQEAGNIDIQKELEVYGQGVTLVSGALPPPFNAIGLGIGAVMTAVGGIAGAFAKGKQAKHAQTTVVTGIVDSVGALLAALPSRQDVDAQTAGVVQPPVMDIETAKDILARAQVKVPAAAAAVREVLDAQKPVVVAA